MDLIFLMLFSGLYEYNNTRSLLVLCDQCVINSAMTSTASLVDGDYDVHSK